MKKFLSFFLSLILFLISLSSFAFIYADGTYAPTSKSTRSINTLNNAMNQVKNSADFAGTFIEMVIV